MTMSVGRFLLGAIRDPTSGDLSSARVTALASAFAGIVFAFVNPSEAPTTGVLLGGGAAALLTRAKAAATPIAPPKPEAP